MFKYSLVQPVVQIANELRFVVTHEIPEARLLKHLFLQAPVPGETIN